MFINLINREKKLPVIIFLAIIAFLSFNIINKNFFKNLRFDLTKSDVYTLSDGTKSILKSINEPLDFKLFFTGLFYLMKAQKKLGGYRIFFY